MLTNMRLVSGQPWSALTKVESSRMSTHNANKLSVKQLYCGVKRAGWVRFNTNNGKLVEICGSGVMGCLDIGLCTHDTIVVI